MSLFLDTGFLIALESTSDSHHKAARIFWREFTAAPEPLVTTSYVFDETVTFFNNRGFHAKAVEIGQRLLSSRLATLVHVDEPLLNESWQYFLRHSDKRYSLTDCVSFVVMRRHAIKRALAFDRHFTRAGFEIVPVP